MRPLAKRESKILDRLSRGLDVGESRKIDTAPGFMAVHVERIGPSEVSVAHYYEQMGDLMRDPEMIFWYGPDGRWYPIYFRHDPYVEQFSVQFEGGDIARWYPRLQREHATFAATWMRNIRDQQDLP